MHQCIKRKMAEYAEQSACPCLRCADARNDTEPARLLCAKPTVPEAQPAFAERATSNCYCGNQKCAGQRMQPRMSRVTSEHEQADRFEVNQHVREREYCPAETSGNKRLY